MVKPEWCRALGNPLRISDAMIRGLIPKGWGVSVRLSPQEKTRIVRLWSAEPPSGDLSGVGEPLGLFVEEPLCRTYDYADLRTLFDAFVERIPDGGRCLDLAAGTKAASEMLRTAANRRGIQIDITTIDLGEPLVARSNDSELGVDFIGHTPPSLPEKSFHAVISVFGFERLQPKLAIPWLRNILVPGGVVNCLAMSRESTMVGECCEYLRTFDLIIRPWWSDLWGTLDLASRLEVARRSQLAIEQLEVEAKGPSILNAHQRTIRRFSTLAETAPDEINATWRQQTAQAELLRARMACAADFRVIRQFVRELDLNYFIDECVVPFQLNGWPFGWHWEATRPDSRP